MVLGRDLIAVTDRFRAEVVTFAVADRRAKAYVLIPAGGGKLPATIRFAPYPSEVDAPGEVRATVVAPLDPIPIEAAARSMMASLEEVDPERITVIPQ
jgi:hypothetical protein